MYKILCLDRSSHICAWWKGNRNGYINNCNHAGLFTEEEVGELLSGPNVTDVAIKASDLKKVSAKYKGLIPTKTIKY